MRTRFKFLTYGLMALSISIISCEKDGTEGPIGPQGQTGQNGTNGVDGQDANANVQAFTYNLESFASSILDQSIPELTQEVLDNDVVVGYLKKSGETYYPIPNTNLVLGGLRADVKVFMDMGTYSMDFYNVGTISLVNIPVGSLESLRVIIIKSSNSTAGKAAKKGILAELKSQGIDIGNYYAVMDYFRLEY